MPTTAPADVVFWTPQVIVAVITACITIPLAITTALIAWLQFHTAHTRLRLDLYTKRYAIFKAVTDLIETAALFPDKLDLDLTQKFLKDVSEHPYIFGADVGLFLTDLIAAILRKDFDKWFETAPPLTLFELSTSTESGRRVSHFLARNAEANKLFGPYLDFSFIRKLQVSDGQKNLIDSFRKELLQSSSTGLR